ncbi:MAG: GspE/PulE family protein [Candidatus Omnitrophota bacterium]
MLKPGKDVPSVDLNNYIIDPAILNTIPERVARRHKIIPIFQVRDTLTVAMSNPADFIALDEAAAVSGCKIQAVKADPVEIVKAIEQYYTVSNSIDDIIKGLQAGGVTFVQEDKLDLVRIQRIVEEPPVIKLVNLIIAQAIKDNASDIHIEPEEEQVKVRLRIDGIMHVLAAFPRGMNLPVVPRIKVVAGLDITDHRLPQDGRFRVRIEDREVDLRISTFPIAFGEKVVIRILDRVSAFLSLDKLGFSAQNLQVFESLIRKPFGIILVTGPTGSGKTSTLYSTLTKLNSQEKNIITLEDPREQLLQGINQGEVDPEINFTFASGLKAILRQDPDIIMVGEIRDLETAQIAIRAALTGHLVFSTLHTNDASGAITRLVDMGIEPFLISASVIGILAQRLVRVICPKCKEEYSPNEEIRQSLGMDKDAKAGLFRSKGCLFCRHTGYKGRIGIFELLVIDDPIKEMVTKKCPAAEIKQAAQANGMRTLYQDGCEKVINGITTLKEVLRVSYESD